MIGKTVSHYHILEQLGGGGMGVVYKAEDTRLQRSVALKFLPPELTRDPESRERFVHEAQAASALQHENICTIYDVDETQDGQLFISMEYYAGETLRKSIEEGPLPIAEATRIAGQVAQGLANAHQGGIVHRDIKPENIMITRDGGVKIVDFGLAKLAGKTRLTQMGTTLGTVAYMSPEQARGEAVDYRTDVWSLGAVLYEMLTGRCPFRGDHEQAVIYSILNQDPDPVTALLSEVPDALVAVVHRALKKEPEARYGSMAEMLEALKEYQAGSHPAGAGTLDIKALIRKPRVVIPALVVLLASGVGITWWINRSANLQRARQEVLPEIVRLSEGTRKNHELWALFELVSEAAEYIPDDPLLERLWPRFSQRLGIYSDPPGATVYAKPYGNPGDDWQYVGQTPIDSLRFPRGVSRMKLEKEGYRTVYDLAWFGDQFFVLPESGSIPDEMVLVPDTASRYRITAAPAGLHLPGLEHLAEEPTGDFLIDRDEVTNKDFKRFVESGG
jgi:predicted Ser/Thr protein kinase